MDIFSALQAMTYWHWLALGLILLSVELLGSGGFFLWLGISALTIGAALFFLPLNWAAQWVGFVLVSLFSTWLWWKKLHSSQIHSQQTSLNQKETQLIGQVIQLEKDVLVGMNRIKVADGTWSANSAYHVPAGSWVKITAVHGIILTIEPTSALDKK